MTDGKAERPLMVTRLVAFGMVMIGALVAGGIRTNSVHAALEGGIVFGIITAAIFTLACVSMTRESHLEVRNFFVRYRISWGSLFYVIDRSGLQLELRAGGEVLPLVLGSRSSLV